MPQKKSFSELGITDTESKVLESLVMDGPATGSKIAGRLGLHKSVTYFVLEQLTQKGLASFVVINKKRQYRPIDSETLITKLQERKKEFLQNFENTVASIQTVKQKRKSPSFNIFEGWEGMKTALHDIHKTLKAKEDYFVFAVDVPEKIFPRFRRFIRKFHQKRSEKGINCQLLVSTRRRSTIGKDRKKDPHTQVRFVSSEQVMPMAVNVYANKVLLAVWTDPPLAITIENESIANSFKALFQLMWKSGKR